MTTIMEVQSRPQPEKPAVLDTRPAGSEVASEMFSINDKALGAGEPIRVKQGRTRADAFAERQRHREPAHRAAGPQISSAWRMDGNPVPTPQMATC